MLDLSVKGTEGFMDGADLPPLKKYPPKVFLANDEEFCSAVVAHYEAGKTIQEIAEETGRSYSGIREVLVTREVRIRPRSWVYKAPIPPEVRSKLGAEYRKRYENGETIQQITDGSDYSLKMVHILLVEAGTVMRRRGPNNRTRR